MTTPNGSGVINRGTDYQDGSQVTSTNLKEHVDNAVFNNDAVDDITIGLNSDTPKALFVKNQGIDTAQIADDAITFAKLADATLTSIKESIKEALYPTGSLLTTTVNYADSAAVVAAYGGTTWERFGAGQVMVGYDSSDTDFDTVENTGGDKTKSKTIALNQLPNHKHVVPNSDCRNYSGEGYSSDQIHRNSWCDTNGYGLANAPLTGNGVYADNGTRQTQQAMSLDVVQPYITVYMWKRTV